jgi:PKD repeat protein
LKKTGLLRSCFDVGAFLLLLLVSAQTWAFALAWDLESDPSVIGYLVYQGQASGSYTTKVDVGLSSTYAPSNLTGGATYYFSVTAYNAARTESGFSNEVSATASSSAPVASFGASTTTGTAPLALNFINTSTGTITGNSWTFGDGTTSNTQNPVHVYSTAGSYTVSLTVTGPDGSNTQTKNNYISVTSGNGAITFVQVNYAVPQSAPSSVPVTFTGAQTAGNLNVVVVGWADSTAVVNAVTDSRGNVYTRAVGPNSIAGVQSQSIYYAKNIAAAAANTNTVTVQFNGPAEYPDIRILEYSGLDQVNPVDVTAAGTGSGTTSSTPAVLTTNANDMIFGANTVWTHSTGPGAGFTSRVITFPDGDIAEDRIVTSVGSYNASAPMTDGAWVMQMVAFRKAP